MRWLIIIKNDDGSSPTTYFFNGTDDEVKEALVSLAEQDRKEDRNHWEDGTTKSETDGKIDQIWQENGSYFAYNTFYDYGIDYCARPLNDIKTYVNDIGGMVI